MSESSESPCKPGRAVLYLTRSGLLEPLGQSQVMSYLRGLSADYRITLVSFEKPEDLSDQRAVAQARADCEECRIRWTPRRFRHRPTWLAPACSMLELFWLAWRQARARRAELIHARSYIPAAVALAVHRVTGVPFIFDMRALWPEELITAGRLRRGSIMHRAIIWCERACLRRAQAVVSLTEAAAGYLEEEYPKEMRGQNVVVIPTCVNLDRFKVVDKESSDDARFRFGCCGTVVSGWFRLDWLVALYAALSERYPEAEFEIVTRDSMAEVREALLRLRADTSRISIYSARPEEMPGILRAETANVMFYAGGAVSELGRSPTRMAEVLGCGRPVIANRGVGDVAEIIERYRVGVLMASDNLDELDRVVDSLAKLLQDPDLSARCRSAAEKVFSLESGTKKYREVYAQILKQNTPQTPRDV